LFFCDAPVAASHRPARARYGQDVQRVHAFLAMVFVAVATIIGSLLAFVARLLDPSGDRVVDLARLWSRAVLWVAGVRVTVEWRGQLAPNQPYVFMANHLSAADIWTLFVALPVRVRMIAKKQLARIPLFGWAMQAGRFIFIDRANAIAARRSIDEAKRRIRGGHSVLLFPEGTRSRDGKLGAFKKGGFHLAIDSGVPVVPVAIMGTRECMPRDSFLLRSGNVHVVIGEPVPTAGLTEDDRHRLLEKVRTGIGTMLGGPVAEPAATAASQPSP
jgi:1-acyl-sn-glycerol-3-phosphate acyltransferase